MELHKQMSDDLERVIIKEDGTSSIATDSDQLNGSPETFREKLCHILHSHKFQVCIISLVILDCLLVIVELLMDLEMLQDSHDFLVPTILHYLSIGILSIFLVEICFKVYAFRLEFFHHYLEVFDAVVVIISFALDIVFRNTHGAASGVGLIILLRLWRVTRILNGIVLSVKTQSEHQLKKERQARAAVEQELGKFRRYCAAQELEIESLRALLHKHGIEEERPSYEAPVTKLDVIAEVNKEH